MKKARKLLLGGMLLCIGAAMVYAQANPLPVPPVGTGITGFDLHKPVSNADASTAGRFDNEIGWFLSTTNWENMNLDRGFVFAGVKSLSLASPFMEFGVAGKLGTLYLAGYYTGNTVYNPNPGGPTDTSDLQYPESVLGPDGNELGNKDSYTLTKTRTNQRYNSDNSFAVLLGAGTMGFKLHFSQAGYTGKSTGTYYTEEYVKLSESKTVVDGSKGFIRDMKYLPHLAFGTKLSLGELSLTPKAELQIGIRDNQNYGEISRINTVNGVEAYVANTNVLTKSNTGSSVIQPAIKLAATLGFPQKNVASHGVGLEYVFKGDFYSNKRFTMDGGTKAVSGTVTNASYILTKNTLLNTTDTNISWDQKEINVIDNVIKPNYEVSLNFGDRFFIGFDFAVAFGFTNENVVLADRPYSESRQETAAGTTTTSVTPLLAKYALNAFSLTPEISAGAQFAAIQGKLFINAGITVQPGNLTVRSTEYKGKTNGVSQTTAVDGTVTSTTLYESNPNSANYDKTQEKSVKWNPLPAVPYVNLGLSWYITPQVLLDINYKVNTSVLNPSTTVGNTIIGFLSDPITLQLTYKY